MATRVVTQNALNTYYPDQPGKCPACAVNQVYQTLPDYVPWETTAVGPATMKHIYTGVPNYYPYQRITRPVGTLYDYDFSQDHDNNSGMGKRISYQYKIYPYTNRNNKEVREYSEEVLPYMDNRQWTSYPVKRDSSVNSSMNFFPNTYIPDKR